MGHCSRWERAFVQRYRWNAHVTILGNSWRQNASPCDPTRSVMTTSAPAAWNAAAHRVAFSWKNGSWIPATKYALGSELGIAAGGWNPAPGEAQNTAP
jgi:hypothetical protein